MPMTPDHITPPGNAAPPLRLWAREWASFPYLRMAASFAGAAPISAHGTGQKIMVIPGFLASDQSTARLRRSLNAAGFNAYGWGLGRNMGVNADIFSQLDKQLDMMEMDEEIIFIGWSLGGLIAREFAKYAPGRVAKVITLGSPFSGGLRANNVWRIYEIVAGHKVDNLPLNIRLHEKPPVPTVAFWSSRDGIVAGHSACGHPHESDHQVELDCTHMAFIAQPGAIAAIANEIAN